MQDLISAPVTPASSRIPASRTTSPNPGFHTTALEMLAHDLRQPLSTIDHLAYYLQLISDDPAISVHSQRIQELIEQANRILERAVAANSECCSNV
jgi:hypothetical protein